MSGILSREAADAEVIKNLHKEIRRLEGVINKMSQGKLLLDTKGNIYLAKDAQLVSEAGVLEQAEEAKKQLAELEEVQKFADKLQAETTSGGTNEVVTPPLENAVTTPDNVTAPDNQEPVVTPAPSPVVLQ